MAKIILPDRIFGRNVDGAMEKVLNGDKSQPEPVPEQTTPQTNAPNLNGYIFVPSIKLYVAKERTLLGSNWNDTQAELKKQKLAMPTPYQFRELLKYLRGNKTQENQRIFNEITEVREPWRSEWLNARFEDDNGKAILVSENVLVNGIYERQEQRIANYLDKDKTPGISLDAWIDSNTPHGLPDAKISKGKLYYWSPVNGFVARFGALSGRAYLLCCYGGADYSDPSLGVRACAEGAVAKNSGSKK